MKQSISPRVRAASPSQSIVGAIRARADKFLHMLVNRDDYRRRLCALRVSVGDDLAVRKRRYEVKQ
jgi:hypothetical protein